MFGKYCPILNAVGQQTRPIFNKVGRKKTASFIFLQIHLSESTEVLL
jgi:hypothetical protein